MEQRRGEIRVAQGRVLEGYAARFDTEARIGPFTEVIRRGAFRDLDRDILALADHDPAKLLARTRTGTLELEQDAEGLHYRIQLPDTQLGRDVLVMAERGDLGGMSFGFTVPQGGDVRDGNRRELRAVTLHEISVVSAWPAYDGTSVTARAKPRVSLARWYLETL